MCVCVSTQLKLFDMREALDAKAGESSRAEEVADLKARLRQAQEERDNALAAKQELEQISAQLLEMVDSNK